jgi:hypothetical protein
MLSNEVFVGLLGLGLTTVAYIYGRGKREAKEETKTVTHARQIESLNTAQVKLWEYVDDFKGKYIRIEEALNRTYLTRDSAYETFVKNSEFETKVFNIENQIKTLEEKMIHEIELTKETMLQKMDGVQASIQLILDLKRGIKNG